MPRTKRYNNISNKEIYDVVGALDNWFKSQDVKKFDAINVMHILMGAYMTRLKRDENASIYNMLQHLPSVLYMSEMEVVELKFRER